VHITQTAWIATQKQTNKYVEMIRFIMELNIINTSSYFCGFGKICFIKKKGNFTQDQGDPKTYWQV